MWAVCFHCQFGDFCIIYVYMRSIKNIINEYCRIGVVIGVEHKNNNNNY